MKKNTQDEIENDYKEAIREKYRNEKIEGKYSHYLNNPSQALLRDLCWEIFNSEPKSDDLAIYRTFFKSDFIPNEEDTSPQYTDKFKKVGAFYKGGIQTSKISTVELAAILVDFENRPLKKFIKKRIEEGKPLNDKDFFTDTLKKKLNSDSVEVVEEIQANNFIGKTLVKEKVEILREVAKPKSASLFVNIKEKIERNFRNRFKYTAVLTMLIFSLIASVIYYAFFKKHCMQWSDDHYEIVDCSLGIKNNLNEIISLDNSLLDFRKIKACDTTKCFLSNGQPFLWYGKTENGIDVFNDIGKGWHPENKKSLHPMTPYMFNKYLKGKSCH